MCAALAAVAAGQGSQRRAGVDDEVERPGRCADAHVSREVAQSVQIALQADAIW